MIKPNAWKISENLSTVESYSTTDGATELKHKLSNNDKVYGWAKRNRKVYLLTNEEKVIERFGTSSSSFKTLNEGIKKELIYYFIDSKLKQYGFRRGQRGVLFLPKSMDDNSFTKYNRKVNCYINFAIEFTVQEFKSENLLVVNPSRTITKDGDEYDAKYASSKNKKLFDNKEEAFNYAARVKVLKRFKKIFGNQFRFKLSDKSYVEFKLKSTIDNQIEIIPEPVLDFGKRKTHTWPKQGLNQYGPLDYNETHLNRPKEIKVALIGTENSFDLLSGLDEGVGSGRFDFPGFRDVFKTNLTLKDEPIRFQKITQKEINGVQNQGEIVDLLLNKAMQIKNANVEFDLCIIELVPGWEKYFTFNRVDLHDLIKAEFSRTDIRTQIITENSESSIKSETLNNLALGIYYKSGGNPWRLVTEYKDIAYVGITFGYVKNDNKRLIGIAELFDCYGQFVALRSIGIKEIARDKYFNKRRDYHLSIDHFTQLIDSLLGDYRNQLDGNLPKNLVIHKSNYFNSEELSLVNYYKDHPINLSLVHIQEDHNWHLVKSNEPTRGSFWQLSDDSALLYTSGSVNGKYFQLGCPLPLLVHSSYSDNYSLKELCEQIIELTKLNFNSTNTYSKEPATLLHSRKIVNLLRVNMPKNEIPKDPRFFL